MWNFSTFLFVQATLTLIVNLYKTISIKNNLKQNITIFSSIAHDFFNILTAQMVNDLKDTHPQKPTLPLKTSKYLDNFPDNSTNSINNHTGITSPPPLYTKRPNKLHMTRFNLFPKNIRFLIRKLITEPLHFLLHKNSIRLCLIIQLLTPLNMTT